MGNEKRLRENKGTCSQKFWFTNWDPITPPAERRKRKERSRGKLGTFNESEAGDEGKERVSKPEERYVSLRTKKRSDHRVGTHHVTTRRDCAETGYEEGKNADRAGET